jgi:hypothetical protein
MRCFALFSTPFGVKTPFADVAYLFMSEAIANSDFSDAPPCGTACGLCIGHFCRAEGWLGETPICRPCGEGKPCERALAVEKAHAALDPAELAVAAPTSYERRCSDCKAAMNEMSKGSLCPRCKKRAKEIADRQVAAAERAAELATGMVS